MPTERAASIAASAQADHAARLSAVHRPHARGERSSESPSRVSRRNRRGSPRCRLRPRGRRRVYAPSRRDRRDEDREDEERAEHDAVDPAGVGDERQAREQEHREREDVEAAVEHDRREASPAGVRSARDPARPEQVADPPGQHVVHRHARRRPSRRTPPARGACPRSSSTSPPAASRRLPMQATAPTSGASRTSCSVRQTAPRSAPRIARKRKTADAGMPTIAATARERLRRLPGASDRSGPTAVSGTTVTGEGCGAVPSRGQRQRSRRTLAVRPDRSRAAAADH